MKKYYEHIIHVNNEDVKVTIAYTPETWSLNIFFNYKNKSFSQQLKAKSDPHHYLMYAEDINLSGIELDERDRKNIANKINEILRSEGLYD